jgi:hypothetical protein
MFGIGVPLISRSTTTMSDTARFLATREAHSLCLWLAITCGGCSDGGASMPTEEEGSTTTSVDSSSTSAPSEASNDATSNGDGDSGTGDEDVTGTTGTEPPADFLSIYIAGEEPVAPADLPDDLDFEARPEQVGILSNGDFVVFGEEEYVGSSGGRYYGRTVFRFSGKDGTLVWKDKPTWSTAGQAPTRLLGVASDDASYLAKGGGTSRLRLVRYEPDGEISLESPDSGEALEAELDGLNPTGSKPITGSLVTNDDFIVVGLTVNSTTGVFAVYDASAELLRVSTQPMTIRPRGFRERATGEVVAIAVDITNQVGQQGARLQLVTLQPDTGELSAVTVGTDEYVAGPAGSSEYEASWYGLDLQTAEDGDVWVTASESYSDDNPPRHHIFRIASDGSVVAHALAEPDPSMVGGHINIYSLPSLTVTPEGPLVVGYYHDVIGSGFYTYPIAYLYDEGLSFLRNHQLAELADHRVEWASAATRDGRTIFVGEINRDTIVLHGTAFGD